MSSRDDGAETSFQRLFRKHRSGTRLVRAGDLTVHHSFDDSRLAKCCKAGCWLHLARRVALGRDAAFDLDEFWQKCRSGPPVFYADADSWAMWGLKRLEETPGYKPWCGRRTTPHVVSCELHVGFLYIAETPEQLARLRQEYLPPLAAAEARSKIFQTNLVPRPIDATAARVAQEE